MKRGNDDEKMMGPLFPRLHVGDTEKGGPRAPPRNKMALYEQFSIPSQRFNLPLHPNMSNSVPPASSSQGTVHERNYVFPGHLTPETLIRQAGKHPSRQTKGANLNGSIGQLEHRKKVDEDDFRVPVYVRSNIGQSNEKRPESFDGKRPSSTGSRCFGFLKPGKIDREREPKQHGSALVNAGTDVRNEIDGPPQVSPNKEHPFTSARDESTGERIDTLVRQAKVTPNQEVQDRRVFKLSSLRQGDGRLRQDCRAESQSNGHGQSDGLLESTREVDKSNRPIVNQTSPTEAIDGTEYHDTGTGSPKQLGNLNKNDNISKISRVENLSTVNISPDDVVAVIGQKHFWKARKEIANQQRVFAVQVFELHRLIKVQQLIAGSPELLFDDGAFLGKSLPDESTPKKLSLEYVVKARLQNLKRKVDSEKINQNMECSAENAVGKTSISSVKNTSHLSNSTPFAGNPHQGNMAADNGMGPWCFNQSPGHQWLIPVMSPSEGLIYKPYPGPGFTGTNFGGCGPYGASPSGGTFTNPSYGIPPPPETPPGSHAYLPPYGGMPVMKAAGSESAVEHVNQFSARTQNHRLSEDEADCNKHNQSSCNLPVQRNGATSHVMFHQRSKEFERQMSTASSPSEMPQEMSTGHVAEGRDVLPLFPMVPVEPESAPHSLETGQQSRVIKVVPHNRRSATESAARIFQSIQEERKQYDAL
ncbi:protein EARLY FLOWERING 3-like [Vicia villosa]|uniref:protein EARLY FLOWERING 3-like n=1 Tax=Vicia villosa TaxID=3911 RepID=UPI00273C9366|nr:protein EARLY FLOWERING 3-like [Vicia villosa]